MGMFVVVYGEVRSTSNKKSSVFVLQSASVVVDYYDDYSSFWRMSTTW